MFHLAPTPQSLLIILKKNESRIGSKPKYPERSSYFSEKTKKTERYYYSIGTDTDRV